MLAVKALSVFNLQLLELARDSLFQGDTGRATERGRAALARTTVAKDNDLTAHALLLLARAHIMESKMARGYQYASQAASMFEAMGNPNGRADALALAVLGATALRSSSLGMVTTDLHEVLDDGGLMDRVFGTAYNHLGVSAMWDGRYKESAFALMLAHGTGHGIRGDADFQPRTNLFMLEILQVIEWERKEQGRVDYSHLVGIASICERAKRNWYSAPIPRGLREIGLLMLDFANCFTAVRTGDMPKAYASYHDAVLRVIPMPVNSWQVGLAMWARAEVARGIGDLHGARAALKSMRHAARAGEHAPLERLAVDLRADVEHALMK